MLKNQDIICLSSADWDNPYWTNQQHIMSRLSSKNRVLYVESLGLRRPALQKKDILRMRRRLKRCLGIRRMGNLYIYSPIVLPIHDLMIVRKLNHLLLFARLKEIIKRFKFKNPILWSYIPNAIDFIGRLGERLSIYHCTDNLSANPRISKEVVKGMEIDLILKVDIVFTSSKTLYDEKKILNKKTYYLPNVADSLHFSKAMEETTQIPHDIRAIPHPIIGFIGAISAYKLDFELIRKIATSHREWSVVLVGDTGEGEKASRLSELRGQENIYIIGGRDYKILPNYLKAFDCAILPCRINDYTRYMFPMKFFEYLASGRPVVSTDLPSLREYEGCYRPAKDHFEFIHQIDEALAKDTEEEKKKRVGLALKYTWEDRLEELSFLIEERLRDAGK